MIMKNIIKTIIIFSIIFFIPNLTLATSYYISNSGNDLNLGNSINNAWKTISKVNSFSFSDGDTLYFKRGDVFIDSTLLSPKVDNFTIGAYGDLSSSLPIIDGNKILPIYIEDNISNLTIENIDISGQDWQYNKAYNIVIKNVNDININNIIGNGHYESINSEGKSAVLIKKCTGSINITNCNLYNWGPAIIPSETKDFMGIAFIDIFESNIYINNNIIHDINADCIYFQNCKPSNAIVSNNTLYNAGENAIDCKGMSNLNIHQNLFYRKDEFIGWGGSSAKEQPLIAIHYYIPNLYSSHNINIFENKFQNLDEGPAFFLAGNSHNYVKDINIFRNLFKNIAGAVHVRNYVSNTLFYSNLIIDPVENWTDYGDTGGIFSNNIGDNIKIYNNTIISNNGSLNTAINLQASGENYEIYNNIVKLNKSNPDGYIFKTSNWPSSPIVSHNLWYNESDSRRIYSSKGYTTDNFALWQSNHTGEMCINPKLDFPNYNLLPDSPCIDSGKISNLTTDYFGNPVPLGGGYDIGAIEYFDILPPKELKISIQ